MARARGCSVKRVAFSKFEDTAEAVVAAADLLESKMCKQLKKFLTKNVVKKELTDELAVSDAKLGGVIKEKLGIPCVFNSSVMELMRGLRSQVCTPAGEGEARGGRLMCAMGRSTRCLAE